MTTDSDASHTAELKILNAEIQSVEVSLERSEEQVRRQARRLETLWHIVNTPHLAGEELVIAMLREAASAIRPDQAYIGILGHIDGEDYVLDAVAGPSDDAAAAITRTLAIGARTPASDMLLARHRATGRTQSWPDCQSLTDLPLQAREAGLRSQIATRFHANNAIYVLALASVTQPSATPFDAEDSEYIEVVAAFFRCHIERKRMEASLRLAEFHARQPAERLAALWQIANNPLLRGEELILAMLRQAAEAIRPHQHFHGLLGRIEGEEVVVVAVGADPGTADPISRVHTGRRTRLDETVVPNDEITRAWDDLEVLKAAPAGLSFLGWRSAISTRFSAGNTQYWLVFGSPQPASPLFDTRDFAYIELLASSFADHIQVDQLELSLRDAEVRSRWHAERLEGLWQIANDPSLKGKELVLAMLRQAAATIRPEQEFCGLLGRIEETEVVVIGVGASLRADGSRSAPVPIGNRAPLDQTPITPVSRTRAWDDLTAMSPGSSGLLTLGWRAAISTQFKAGGLRYSLTFGSPEPMAVTFGPEDSAFLDVLAASFANQLQVGQLEGSLRDEEARSQQHAERLDALRKIVNSPNLQEHELLLAMLNQAAASLRPGHEYRGVLWNIGGTEAIVEAVSTYNDGLAAFRQVGSTVPLVQTVIAAVAASGRGTRSWDDFQTSSELSQLAREQHTRSLIVTTFSAGGSDWGISFASSEVLEEGLGPQDHAYVEVVASLFANHLQQRWQFRRIEYQQSHDALTGLLSRSHFRSKARAAAHLSASYAIILVNIDAFREINETRGHMIGDAVLVEVAHALQSKAVAGEIVGRIEGDVFGVYLPHPASEQAVNARALAFADVFVHPFSTGDRDGIEAISRTGSLGIAIAPADGIVIDAILSHAGAALVNAKDRGCGSIVFYEPGMEGDAARRASFRNELAKAVAQDQFELYYQPHVEIDTGIVSGCEALIRWNHPVRGLLLPNNFIPFAEQNGTIGSIDSWVMEHAFAAANELAATRPGFRVYFNLSGRQSGDANVIRAFTNAARSGVVLDNIGVEITESDAMRDVEATRRVCRALRRLNVRIAIDDFGTGYSSLSSLKRLPVDIVKIDQSFISGIPNDRHDETIAETILSITQNFGFEALAEGVEQPAQVAWLRGHSCHYMQGFAICRPLAFGAFKEWLARPAHGPWN